MFKCFFVLFFSTPRSSAWFLILVLLQLGRERMTIVIKFSREHTHTHREQMWLAKFAISSGKGLYVRTLLIREFGAARNLNDAVLGPAEKCAPDAVACRC